jgi:hypothetical protein
MNLRRILVALVITLFLGPGAGHIYLRRFMRGIALILATLASAAHMAWRIGNSLPVNTITLQNYNEVFQRYFLDHPRTVFLYDAFFAALWAFALVDAYLIASRKAAE